MILAGGIGDEDGDELIAVSFSGRKKWSLTLPGAAYSLYSASAASSRPWVAVGMRGGLVHVIDTTEGKIIASVGAQGDEPQIAWLASKSSESPLLVIATGRAIKAYIVASNTEEN